MDIEILEFIYLDFLLDSRFPKNFSETSDDKTIASALLAYFDDALDKKGYNYGKTSFHSVRPEKYSGFKSIIVDSVFDELMSKNIVFKLESHPLFGKKCTVDSNLFIEVLSKRKRGIKISSDFYLEEDIKNWGLARFRDGITILYKRIGGFFDSNKWVDFEDAAYSNNLDVIGIPASDRIVEIDHNAPPIVEIVDQANILVKHLQTANDIGNLTSDEASAAANEVKQIITAFEGSRLRVNQVVQISKLTLAWIASKAAESLVGTIATALLVLIATYFGITL